MNMSQGRIVKSVKTVIAYLFHQPDAHCPRALRAAQFRVSAFTGHKLMRHNDTAPVRFDLSVFKDRSYRVLVGLYLLLRVKMSDLGCLHKRKQVNIRFSELIDHCLFVKSSPKLSGDIYVIGLEETAPVTQSVI